MTAETKITHEDKIRLLSELLLSQPWTLVSVGLGSIKGEDLANALLDLSLPKPPVRVDAAGTVIEGHFPRDGGADLIAAERQRQITKEGYNALHDAGHERGELIAAAMCYASVPLLRLAYKPDAAEAEITEVMATRWPWEEEWWKPDSDAVRNLVKAGALIAAEIDRLQRMQRHVEAIHFDPGARGLADA